MLGRYERANEVVRRSIQTLDVFLGVVALVEDDRNLLAAMAELMVAFGEVGQHAGESNRVGPVPFVDTREQRDVEIPGDHERQSDNTQIGPFGLCMAPLGKPARVVRSQEGVEVGRIVEEGAQVDVKLLDKATGQILLDRGEGPFIQVLHMIPKALTAQCGSTQREQPAKNSAAV